MTISELFSELFTELAASDSDIASRIACSMNSTKTVASERLSASLSAL